MNRYDVTADCRVCHRTLDFTEWADAAGRTVDTAGGMLFEDGWTCDRCLGGDAEHDSLDAMRRLS